VDTKLASHLHSGSGIKRTLGEVKVMQKIVFSNDQLQTMKTLYVDGANTDVIAKVLHTSKSSVWRQLTILGILRPRGKAKGGKGYLHTEKTKQRIRETHIGEQNGMWKGDATATVSSIRERLRRTYPDVPKGYEIHHIDGNYRNNDPTNLMMVTRREHMLLDGRLQKFKQYHRGVLQ
jgi:hypothetical protein